MKLMTQNEFMCELFIKQSYRSCCIELNGFNKPYSQCWESYFGNVIGYRLQVTLSKM